MNEPWLWWIGVGLVLLAAETMLPGVFLVWIGAASIGAGLLVAWLGWGFVGACTAFLALLAAGIAFSLSRRRLRTSANTPGAGLVGRMAVLIEADATGARVRLGDSDWPARLLAPAQPGAALLVVAVENTTLVVQPT